MLESGCVYFASSSSSRVLLDISAAFAYFCIILLIFGMPTPMEILKVCAPKASAYVMKAHRARTSQTRNENLVGNLVEEARSTGL